MHLQILVALVAMTSLVTSSAQERFHCESSCGNVTIAFPFGSEEGCYYNSEFRVTCDRSLDQPKAIFGDYLVTNISISASEMEIMMLVAYDCYDSFGKNTYNDPKLRLRSFQISTKNRFVAIGCDTYGYIQGTRGTESSSTGCISRCSNNSRISNGSCSGVGCCETSIPEGMSSFNLLARSFDKHADMIDFNPCSQAFVANPEKFHFSANYLRDQTIGRQMPMLLEWAIGDSTCLIAQKKQTSFLCKDNSECDQDYVGPGYRCRCTYGYKGNPYVNCTNINECGQNNGNCAHKCIDTQGSYICSCPKGYVGDGRKDGSGCTADQSLVIKIAVCVSSTGVLFLVAIICKLYKVIKKTKAKRQRKGFFKRNGGLLLKQQEEADPSLVNKTILFTSRELEKATDNFNDNRILGRGGQGTVYKGMLVDGRIVAIKKSKVIDESQLEEFINEVVILSQVNHRNVVRLLGCCLETDVPLLVSEFILNGTLYDRIHDETHEFPMSLNMRLQVATEVAGALAYLHSATSIPIYHRDIKTTNILLDDKYRAKVSDFGTSKFVPIEQTHLTTMVKGTFGYLDPVYFQSSQFTEKSDVYSFGVVLVELLTGERPISLTRFGGNRSLATHFMLAMEEGRVMSIFDALVIKEGDRAELMVVANLAMRCLNLNGKYRPTMKEVVVELETIRMSHIPSVVQTNTGPVIYGHQLSMLSYGESTSTS